MSTVVITGASSGIGKACAELYAQKGFNLLLIARRFERLEKIKAEIESLYPIKATPIECDVRDFSLLETRVSQFKTEFNEVSIVIHCAGLAKGLNSIQDGNISDWNEMIDTNIKGVLHLTKLVLPILIKKNTGHIVILGSVAGFVSYPKGNVYSATKAATKALTESLRLDLMGTQIRVSEISPGMVETEFSLVRLGDPVKAKTVYKGMTPLAALDIAETVIWVTTRPPHVNIQELLIYSTDQASPNHVHRTGL